MNRYCCDSFRDLLSGDGRGFSAYRNERGGFFLRFDAIDEKDLQVFGKTIQRGKQSGNEKFNISVSGEIGIQYCPWCGVLLNKDDGV